VHACVDVRTVLCVDVCLHCFFSNPMLQLCLLSFDSLAFLYRSIDLRFLRQSSFLNDTLSKWSIRADKDGLPRQCELFKNDYQNIENFLRFKLKRSILFLIFLL